MTSRERVHACLQRQPADRVPIFMWFHPETTRRLGELLEIPAACVGEAMGNDVRQTWVNNNYAMEGIVHERDGEGHTDYWGISWVKEGSFNQIAALPAGRGIAARRCWPTGFPYDHLEDLLAPMAAVWPQGGEYLHRLRRLALRLRDVLAAARHGGGACWTWPRDPELADDDVRALRRFRRARWPRRPATRFPLDWLWTGDDVAGQRQHDDEPGAWRELIKPHLARVFAVGKSARPAGGLPLLRRAAADHPRPDRDRAGRAQPRAVQLPRHGPARAEARVRRAPGLHGRRGHAGAAAARHAPTRCAARPRG